MSSIRVAVVGGGHLGTIHARLLQQVDSVELRGIVEPSATRAEELCQQFPCRVYEDLDTCLRQEYLDAAVVAAPTTLHHTVGTWLLDQGIHCLIEKPLAPTQRECEDLVAAAERSGAVLQVGHVERFNPAWTALRGEIGEPRLIEAAREAPLTFRSLDAGVILDLMIHDIDLVLSVVKSPIVQVQATGFAWTGPAEDFAQARFTFANGAVANLTASRISTTPKREMRLWGQDWYSEIDFATRRSHIVDAPATSDWQVSPFSAEQRQELMDSLFESVTPRTDLAVAEANPILDELLDFVTSIQTRSQPIVSGEAAMAAVAAANQVQQNLTRRHMLAPSDYRRTPRKAG